MTTSTGSLHTGQLSPRACSARAQSKQHAMWPVSPWTNVAFRASVRQTTQSDSLPTARSTSGPVSAGRGLRGGAGGGGKGGGGATARGSDTPTNSTTSRSRGGSRLSRCEIQPRAGPSTRSLGTQWRAGWSEYCFAVTSTVRPHGITETIAELSSTVSRTTAPSLNTTLNVKGAATGNGSATGPLCPLNGLRSSEIQPSSVRSLARPCSLTLLSLTSKTASFGRVKACVDANSKPLRTYAPSRHTTTYLHACPTSRARPTQHCDAEHQPGVGVNTRKALSPSDCFLASRALGDESCLSDSSGNDEAWSTSIESPLRSVQSTRLSSSFDARTSQRSATTCHAWPWTGGRGGCAKGWRAVPERTESIFVLSSRRRRHWCCGELFLWSGCARLWGRERLFAPCALSRGVVKRPTEVETPCPLLPRATNASCCATQAGLGRLPRSGTVVRLPASRRAISPEKSMQGQVRNVRVAPSCKIEVAICPLCSAHSLVSIAQTSVSDLLCLGFIDTATALAATPQRASIARQQQREPAPQARATLQQQPWRRQEPCASWPSSPRR